MNARCRAHQIVRILEFLETERDLKFFIRSLARAFDIGHCRVKRAFLCSYEDRAGREQHSELSPEVEYALVDWIAKKAYDNKAVNRTELLNYCITNSRTAITRGWVDSLMSGFAA
jgi:hypothetical protein